MEVISRDKDGHWPLAFNVASFPEKLGNALNMVIVALSLEYSDYLYWMEIEETPYKIHKSGKKAIRVTY